MNYVCSLCSIDPLSHSLTKLKETDSKICFYTCPSEAKLYFDSESIIHHYNGVLSEIPNNKMWILILDGKNFDFSHFIQFTVGIQLAKLITRKFSENLLKIIVINPTIYINFTYDSVKMFLSNNVKDKIIFDYKSNDIDLIINNFM